MWVKSLNVTPCPALLIISLEIVLIHLYPWFNAVTNHGYELGCVWIKLNDLITCTRTSSSSRTETSEILKSYSHYNIRSHSCYVCFCITLTLLFMQTMFSLKQQCLTRDIELIIKYRVIWIPLVLTVFSLRTFSHEVKVVQSWFNSE